jgi:hypothetical protein
MKKFLLGTFMLVDLALMAGSAYVLYNYLNHKPMSRIPMVMVTSPVTPVKLAGTAPATSSSTLKAIGNPINVPVPAADTSLRKYLFKYHNPHAHQVAIRADFTGWKAEAMQKDANGTWTYMAPLTPGEYAYCFTADDKTFKDPANKRTKQIGRTMVSAVLVEPLPKTPK